VSGSESGSEGEGVNCRYAVREGEWIESFWKHLAREAQTRITYRHFRVGFTHGVCMELPLRGHNWRK
jgi:hypothetical protein